MLPGVVQAPQGCLTLSSSWLQTGKLVPAGLTGQVADVPYAITANILILQLAGTSLQNECAQPGDAVSIILILHFGFAHYQSKDSSKIRCFADLHGYMRCLVAAVVIAALCAVLGACCYGTCSYLERCAVACSQQTHKVGKGYCPVV